VASGSRNWQHRVMFGVMYRIGKPPWEGHPLPARLLEIGAEPTKGRALEVGCGTGDASIFLARAGWTVTGVDFVEVALNRARSKAKAAGVAARFVRADVTQLSQAGVGTGFDLIVDFGLLHGLSNEIRAGYAREINAAASPTARMILGGFAPGERRGPRGVGRADIETLFGDRWSVSEGKPEPGVSSRADDPIIVYELTRLTANG
jgi:SAM-dependent methyltransferase